MIRKILTIALFAFSLSSASMADPLALVRLCTSTGVLETRLCSSYLEGFVSGHAVTIAMTLPKRWVFCTPDRATFEDVRGAVIRFAEKSFVQEMIATQVMSKDQLVYLALASAFPCPEKRTK